MRVADSSASKDLLDSLFFIILEVDADIISKTN